MNTTMRDNVKELAEKMSYGHHHDGNPFIAPNMKELDQFELANTNFCSYNPDYTGYCSFKVGKYSQGSHYNLYWDGTGIFYFRDWENRTGSPFGAKMKVRFFKFSICEHDMQHTRCLGNCYNEYKCSKCGMVQSIDSSD